MLGSTSEPSELFTNVARHFEDQTSLPAWPQCTTWLINSHGQTIVGLIGDGIVIAMNFIWCWLKIGLDQTGPIREDLSPNCKSDLCQFCSSVPVHDLFYNYLLGLL